MKQSTQNVTLELPTFTIDCVEDLQSLVNPNTHFPIGSIASKVYYKVYKRPYMIDGANMKYPFHLRFNIESLAYEFKLYTCSQWFKFGDTIAILQGRFVLVENGILKGL